MPCHRCGARQTDPVRGASPWRRGVRGSEQVLVCPDCQRDRDWTAELSHCASCGSARLVRVLGRTECKDCGAEDSVVAEPDDPAAVAPLPSPSEAAASSASSLSDEVRAALDRQFGH